MSSLNIHPAEYLPSNAVHNRTSGVNKKHWEKGAVHTYNTGGWYILAWPSLPVFVLHATVINDNYIMHAHNNMIMSFHTTYTYMYTTLYP